MNKLYALNVIKESGAAQRALAFSDDIFKLCSITTCDCWTIINDPNDKTLKRESQKGIMPFYTIREVPLVS